MLAAFNKPLHWRAPGRQADQPSRPLTPLIALVLAVVVILVYGALGAYMVRHNLAPQVQAASQGKVLRTDLYARWYPGRALLRGIDPYSDQVTQDIASVQLEAEGVPENNWIFGYPLWVIWVLLPLVLLPFSAALLTYVAGCVASLLILSFALLRQILPRSNPWVCAAVALALPLVQPVYSAIGLQTPSLLVLVLLLGATVFTLNNRLAIAGACMAAALIKPQLSIPLAAFGLIWALTCFRRRVWLPAGFGIVSLACEIASQVALPGWEWEFLASVRSYGGGTGAQLGLSLVTTRTPVVLVLAAVVWVGTLWFWRRACLRSATNADLLDAIGATAAATLLAFPRPVIHFYDQMLILLAVAALLPRLWRGRPAGRWPLLVVVVLLLVPFLAVATAGPIRQLVSLSMVPFRPTLGAMLESPLETAAHFYDAYLVPAAFVALVAFKLRERSAIRKG